MATASHADERIARAAEVCARNGGRLTEIRRVVLESIMESREPMGAYALLDRLRARKVGSAAPQTVYRALDFLLANGLIHRVEKLNAFVSCAEEAGHAHPAQFLICDICGTVMELEDEGIAQAVQAASAKAGFRSARATVEIGGVCGECGEAGA